MASQGELVIRRQRTSTPQLSPENFHASLSNAMFGADPVIPGNSPPVETSDSLEASTSQDEPSGAASERQSTSVDESSEDKTTTDESEVCCKKHKHPSDCDKYKCLKSTERSSDEDNGEKSNKGKKQKKLRTSASASSGAADSSAEDPSTKFPKTKSSERPTTTTDDESGWSLSEDHILRGMKEDSRQPSWAEIARTMNRGKKELQNRWKVIKDQPTTADEDGASSEADAKQSSGDFKKGNKQAAKSKDRDTKWHDAPHNSKIISDNKLAKSRAAFKNTTDEILSGEEPSPDCSTTSSSIARAYNPGHVYDQEDNERRRQARYLRTHIQRALYPPSIAPEPDAYLSQEDCDTLAAVDSRYKKARWLEMQANFYNVTGRMVPLGVIREKCERAEEMENSTRDRGGGDGGKDQVEKWVKGVDQENLDDPES